MFITYILRSEKNGKYYIGSTDDLEKRLIRHNKGYSRYTKVNGPYKLVYREYYLKSLKSKKAIEKLIKGAIV